MEFKIKNFRAFNEEGVTFNIAPITILTGCNSAGKSSMVKSLLLLNNFFQQMKQEMQISGDCNPAKYRLGITNYAYRLGDFSSVRNRESKDDTISFSYKLKPKISSEAFVVTYFFKSDASDALNDGWLDKIDITNIRGEVVCSITSVNGQIRMSKCNWSLLKDSFAQFGVYSLQRILSNQISINEILPEASSYNEDDIKRFRETIEEVSKRGWTKSISTENIADFNDAYVNNEDTKEIFGNVSDLLMIKEFLDGNMLLHSLPVLDVVKELPKKEVRSFLQKDKEAWNADMDAIITAFENSDSITLGDFVREQEESKCLCDIGKEFGRSTQAIGLQRLLHDSLAYYYQIYIDYLDMRAHETVASCADGSLRFDKSVASQEAVEALKQKRREALPFEFMIATLWKYSMKIDESFKKLYDGKHAFDGLNGFRHPIMDVFAKYGQALLLNLMLPSSIFEKFIYVGSSKAEAQRLYKVDASNMDSFEKTINDYFGSKRNHQGDYVPDTFLNKWIRNFNIGHSITIKNAADGLGIVVYLHTSEEDTTAHLLADEGYGITQLLSVLLNIETAILEAQSITKIPKDRKLHKLALIHEDLDTQYTPAYIAIEEPEIHLHPKYQSLLMDMFDDAYRTYNVRFIIETHSEYLVRRSQVLVAEAKYKDEKELEELCPYKVFYIPQPKTGKPYDLVYKVDGKFEKRFGKGFFDVADDLMLDLL